MSLTDKIDALLSSLQEAGNTPPKWGKYAEKVKFMYELLRKMREELPKKDPKQAKEDVYTLMGLAVEMLSIIGYSVYSAKLKTYVDLYKAKPEPRPDKEEEPEEEPEAAEKERLRK